MAYVPGGNYLQQGPGARGETNVTSTTGGTNRPNNPSGNVSYISNQQQIQQPRSGEMLR